MKNTLFSAILILLAALLISVCPTDADAEIYEDTLRLHILANSDTESDQALKLEIRDEILNKYGTLLSQYRSIEEAKTGTEKMLGEIESFAEDEIRERGYSYDVCVGLGEEWYGTREYDGFTLPCGTYTSLRVIIGDGEGKNWWCVMYPPMCMEIATERAHPDDALIDYSESELALIKCGKYNVKFKLLEILSLSFTKNS